MNNKYRPGDLVTLVGFDDVMEIDDIMYTHNVIDDEYLEYIPRYEISYFVYSNINNFRVLELWPEFMLKPITE